MGMRRLRSTREPKPIRSMSITCVRLDRAPGKPPVVMVHGGGHTGTCYLATPDLRPGWAPRFAAAGRNVFVPDWPGHGRSPMRPDFATLGTRTSQARCSRCWRRSGPPCCWCIRPAARWPGGWRSSVPIWSRRSSPSRPARRRTCSKICPTIRPPFCAARRRERRLPGLCRGGQAGLVRRRIRRRLLGERAALSEPRLRELPPLDRAGERAHPERALQHRRPRPEDQRSGSLSGTDPDRDRRPRPAPSARGRRGDRRLSRRRIRLAAGPRHPRQRPHDDDRGQQRRARRDDSDWLDANNC